MKAKGGSGVRAEEIQAVTHALCVWQAYDPACKSDLTSAAHVLADRRLVLVDPIGLGGSAEAELLARGKPAAVVLTNGNHERAAASFARRWQVPVLCHPEAAAEVSLRPDACVGEGEVLFGELTVIALPGAGPGELGLYRAAERILSLGDIVINLPGHGFSRLPDKYCRNPRQARTSLRKLRGLDVSHLTFAHGLPITRDTTTRLTALTQEEINQN